MFVEMFYSCINKEELILLMLTDNHCYSAGKSLHLCHILLMFTLKSRYITQCNCDELTNVKMTVKV